MRRSIGATLWLLLLAGWAGAAAARQDAQPPAVPGPDVPAAGTAIADAATAERVTTLGEVRAVAPDEDVDLYRFRNPVQVPPNRFDRAYRPPPSVKEVSEGGGYLMLGIYAAAGLVAKGIDKLGSGPAQVQSAIARPPPQLSEDELRRAAACATAGCGGTPGD
jgi:hypothetical protein